MCGGAGKTIHSHISRRASHSVAGISTPSHGRFTGTFTSCHGDLHRLVLAISRSGNRLSSSSSTGFSPSRAVAQSKSTGRAVLVTDCGGIQYGIRFGITLFRGSGIHFAAFGLLSCIRSVDVDWTLDKGMRNAHTLNSDCNYYFFF